MLSEIGSRCQQRRWVVRAQAEVPFAAQGKPVLPRAKSCWTRCGGRSCGRGRRRNYWREGRALLRRVEERTAERERLTTEKRAGWRQRRLRLRRGPGR